tara:strand:- start:220 stop:552 length:333 start_codon:yes stop_codon:yes gene_type:complete
MAYENNTQSDGAIYINNYKTNEKQPTRTGNIELTKDLLKELVTKVKSGEPAKIRIACWDRTAKSGIDYLYARVDIPQKRDGDSAPQQAPQPTPPKTEEPHSADFDDDIPF